MRPGTPRPAGFYDAGIATLQTDCTMPTYHIEMFEGRTPEQKKKLVEEITRVTVEVLGGSPDSVDIIISDIKRENWATGGKLWSEPKS
jgi:4-oxalocrotonate tautomerase